MNLRLFWTYLYLFMNLFMTVYVNALSAHLGTFIFKSS